MTNSNIKNVIIKLENNQNIIVKPNMFDNLYISNINKNGDEIAFIKQENKLLANFLIINLYNEVVEYNLTNNNLKENAFNILKKGKNIKEVSINFKNGNSQPFIFKDNTKLYSQKNNNNMNILLSEYDLKYKNNLFA